MPTPTLKRKIGSVAAAAAMLGVTATSVITTAGPAAADPPQYNAYRRRRLRHHPGRHQRTVRVQPELDLQPRLQRQRHPAFDDHLVRRRAAGRCVRRMHHDPR